MSRSSFLASVHRLLRALLGKGRRARRSVWLRLGGCDAGQTTAEYGLVILAAGTLALAAILWARNSGSINGLFETVIERLTGSLG